MSDATPTPRADNRPMRQVRRCGAKTRSGTPCQQPAVRDGNRCRMHGGAGLRGPANPAYTHGRLSKHLPPKLRTRALAALNDPELLSLRDSLAVIDSHITEHLDLIAAETAPTTWEEAKTLRDAYETARRRKNLTAMGTILADLFALIERGAAQDTRWVAVREMIQERRKVADTERRRQVDMQQMITAEQAQGLIATLIAAVTEFVHDEPTRRKIAERIMAVAERGAP